MKFIWAEKRRKTALPPPKNTNNSLTPPLWAINNNNMEITEIIQRLESDMLSHKSESYTTVNQFNVGLHHGIASYIESLLPKLKALSSPSSSAGVWVIIPTDLTIKQKAEEYERSYKSTGQPGTCTAFAAGADFVRSLITPQKQ